MKPTFFYFIITVFLNSALLTGCQSPTPYQPAVAFASPYGYAETKLNDNIYRVTFKGNEKTTRETVETYLIYRIAQLAQKEGYDYFVMRTRNTKTIRDLDVTYDPMAFNYPHTIGYPGFQSLRYPYYSSGFPWSYGAKVNVDEKYLAIAYVELKKTKKDDAEYFGVEEVIQELKPQIKFPKGDSSCRN